MFCIRPRVIRRATARFLAAFPGRTLYAIKCNPHPSIIRALYAAGIRHFDAASLPEIAQLRGVHPRAGIYFMHPVKDRYAIHAAYHRFGVRHFAVDHADELCKVVAEAGADDLFVFVRLRTPEANSLYHLASKFGAEPAAAAELVEEAARRDARIGLTFHVGSQCLEPRAFRFFPLFPNVYVWIALEFGFGILTCGFLVLSDALVNAASGESRRGRLLAAYMLSESCGAILGPLLLSGVGFAGLLPFCVASAIMLAGIAPWFLVDALRVPSLGGVDAVPFRAALRSAPLLLLVAAAAAFFQEVPAGLFPVFALQRGLGEATAVLMLSALALGSAVFQLPAGWAADRMARRAFLILLAMATLPLCLALSLAAGSWTMWPVLVVMGGVFQAFELMGLVLLGQRASPSRLAGLTAAATMSASASAFLGPPAAGWLMDAAGPGALLFAICGVAALVLVGCALPRARAHGERPMARRTRMSPGRR